MEKKLWQPIRYDERWADVNAEKFDNILPSWYRRRVELQENPQQYEDFINQIKRKQAIDTGILERMYDLKRGVTETFIEEGFVDSFLQHGDTNISSNLLMDFLNDNYSAGRSFLYCPPEQVASEMDQMPLIIAVKKDVSDLEESIWEQVQMVVMVTLAYIVNEL